MEIIVENEDFRIYGNSDLEVLKDNLLRELSTKKRELLSLFHIETFPKHSIYLFPLREDYFSFLDENKDAIALNYENISKYQMFSFLFPRILHELIGKMYFFACQEKGFTAPLWLKEGLSLQLSGEMHAKEKSENAFCSFFLNDIVRSDRIIPKIEMCNQKKIQEKRFKRDSFCYILVHYLLEQYPNGRELLTNQKQIQDMEKDIIEKCISYYTSFYSVPISFDEIKTDRELLNFMTKNLTYGWHDKNGDWNRHTLKQFRENYRIASIEDTLKYKMGTCIEQTNLASSWFTKMGIENKMYCYRNRETEDHFDQEKVMHCFVLFHYKDYWYYFEHAAMSKRGIHKYESIEDALEDVKEYFCDFHMSDLAEIPYIPVGCSYKEFNQFVNTFENIDLKSFRSR